MSPRSAAILVGGRATRFGGADKPLVEIAGRRILDRQLDVLRPRFDEILLVTRDPAPFAASGLPIVRDRREGAGPLAGIEAALAAAASDEVFVVAGDLPALDGRAIDLVMGPVMGEDARADAVVIAGPRGLEPLHARYHVRVLSRVTAALDEGRLAVHALLDELAVRFVDAAALRAFDPELLCLANVNTPEDAARLAARLTAPRSSR